MATAKRAHYLQHVDFEGLGYIEDWLRHNCFELSATLFFNPAYVFPDPATLDVLIVMGGPMGVYDEQQYGWLKAEKAFINDCLAAGVKILGICLGAQLLADVLGGQVQPATHKEIGWFKVALSPKKASTETAYAANTEAATTAISPNTCLASCIENIFKQAPTVFHWHGDQFSIPPGCKRLLFSEANINQAFVLKDQVLGLQFHLEVTADSLAAMLSHGVAELQFSGDSKYPFIQTKEQLLTGASSITSCHQLLSAILDHWILPEQPDGCLLIS